MSGIQATRAESGCDYCGLPVPGGRPRGDADVGLYCCYGCRFAAAVAQERGEAGRLRWNMTSLGLAIFFSMNVMVFTLVLWSLDVFPNAESDQQTQAVLLWDLFRYLCLLFSLPVLLLLGRPLLENACSDLRRGNFGTDLLLIVGVAEAYVYSAISVFITGGHVYFDVGCMILVAVTLGRWLEATGKWKATDSLKSLAKLLPEQVDVQVGASFESRALNAIAAGDLIRALPGQRIAVDGVIRRGESLIDEQIVTGESQPRSRSAGDHVHGGTLNLDGALVIEATATADGGSLQRLIDAVVASASASDRWRRLADRISAYFTPLVLLIALATFAGHWLLSGFQPGLLAGLAVLLIACPCALGVATPLATWAALGAASRRGILFRNGDAVAKLASVDSICFDKTGTLTDSGLQVDQLITENPFDRDDAFSLAAWLSGESSHVVSQAIQQFVVGRAPVKSTNCKVRAEPGRGVRAKSLSLAGDVLLGNERLMLENGLCFGPLMKQVLARDSAREESCCFIGWQGRVRGVFLLREALRSGASSSLTALRSLGLELTVLTGDRKCRAAHLGKALGIQVEAELLPEDKWATIERLQNLGKSVAMIGDGINDAPALAAADVGIALGCGADVSRDAADVCLIHDDLETLPWAIELSRTTQRTIRQNLTWAFSYNVIGILIAVAGWLNPMLAALAMAISSLLVVSNSLRLAGRVDDADQNPSGRGADQEFRHIEDSTTSGLIVAERSPGSPHPMTAEGVIA